MTSESPPSRYVDPRIGTLSGEAASQGSGTGKERFPVPGEGSEHRHSERAVDAGGGPTYYDRPVIKEPVWIWSVPAYFYAGGVAAGAGIVGAVSQLVDRGGLSRLITRSRWLASAGTAVGTVFLVIDLGRPARFLNMLRVFRPTSAMSVGSWTLAATGGTTAAAAVLPRLGAPRLGDAAGLASGALSPVLGTYTAVLFSDTAVPLWQATRRSMPRFFAASAVTAAASALELFVFQSDREEATLRRLAIGAKVADLAAGAQLEHDADAVPAVGRPLHDGASGAMWQTAKVTTAASLGVSLVPVPTRWKPLRRIVSAVLASVGSLVARFAIFHAGKRSALDPRASFAQQRAGRGAAEVDGQAAVTSAGSRRAI